MRTPFIAVALVAALAAGAAAQSRSSKALADSLERKAEHLRRNAAREQPDPKPTVLTDDEVTAYMNSGRLKVPQGISDIKLRTKPGIAIGTARIDFDVLTAERRRQNPLWRLFSGVHDVEVRARAAGKDGVAEVNVEKVYFDGREIPRFALEFFVEQFIRPKVPQAGLDSRFNMPVRIHSATVGTGKTTLVQK